MLSHGIPIIYQGTEYFFDGGDDPFNRESMWPDIETTVPMLQDFFRRINRIRKIAADDFFTSSHEQVWTNDDIHVVKRGSIMFAVTNVGSNRNFVRNIKLASKVRMVNILDGTGEDELKFQGQDGGKWWAEVNVRNGEPKVFYPVEKLKPYWKEFFTQ
jgi:alpha-amylase